MVCQPIDISPFYFSPAAVFNGGLPASLNFLFSASLFFSNFAGCTK